LHRLVRSRAVRATDGRRVARNQARGVDQFLRHRLASGRVRPPHGDRGLSGQSGERRGGTGAAELQRRVRLQRTDGAAVNGPLVLKLGGELLETPEQRANIAATAATVAAERPLVIVHGGGRAVDAELDRRSIAPKKVDGLRLTDAPTLDVVIAVLGGSANTELVASLVGHAVTAVGLTGVDAGFGRAVRTNAYRATTGAVVDLGYVGDPIGVEPSLIELLLVHGYVPVIASLGVDEGPMVA